MDGYVVLQHAVSQQDWQRQPEREYGPKLLQLSDEMLCKKRCCKSGRGKPQARRWERGEDESRPQETQSAGTSEGVKVIKSTQGWEAVPCPSCPWCW